MSMDRYVFTEHTQPQKWVNGELVEIDGQERLTKETIHKSIKSWSDVVHYQESNRLYYRGNDPYVLSGRRSDRSFKDPKNLTNVTTAAGYANNTTARGTKGEPDWRIPVPYGAKITDTISGYMYKPGSIQFKTEDEAYQEDINQVNKNNDGEIKNSELGIDQSIYGIAYELVHTDGTDNANPLYTQIPIENGIPVYDLSIEKKLIAFIYFYKRRENNGETSTIITVYYSWGKDEWIKGTFGVEGQEMLLTQSIPYFFNEVPVAVYQNNKENIGDFDRVRTLIDAYDYFISDNVNELERFAQAYLVLINARIERGKEHEVKEKRVLELNEQGAAAFLTKDINSQHMEVMARLLREEIHKQSHIVDFTDEKFGGNLSGAALDRLLLDMNNHSNVKEIYFKKGLKTRLRLLGKLIKTPTATLPDIEITMTRNVPQDMQAAADFLMKTNNLISKETRFQQVPFIKDVMREIEKLDEEIGTDDVMDTEAIVRQLNDNQSDR